MLLSADFSRSSAPMTSLSEFCKGIAVLWFAGALSAEEAQSEWSCKEDVVSFLIIWNSATSLQCLHNFRFNAVWVTGLDGGVGRGWRDG